MSRRRASMFRCRAACSTCFLDIARAQHRLPADHPQSRRRPPCRPIASSSCISAASSKAARRRRFSAHRAIPTPALLDSEPVPDPETPARRTARHRRGAEHRGAPQRLRIPHTLPFCPRALPDGGTGHAFGDGHSVSVPLSAQDAKSGRRPPSPPHIDIRRTCIKPNQKRGKNHPTTRFRSTEDISCRQRRRHRCSPCDPASPMPSRATR
jgi:hypothetical protein